MKKILTLLLSFLFLGKLLPLAASELLTNEKIIQLVEAGLSDDVISMTIQGAEETNFDLSVDGIIELKSKKVSDQLLQKMIASQTEITSTPTATSSVNDSSSSQVEDKSSQFPDIAILPSPVQISVGGEYFVRYNFFHERNKHFTTNYTRGFMVPINTKVKVLSIGDDEMNILVNGQEVKVENVEKYTQRSIQEIASEMLGTSPVPIEKLGNFATRHISNGQLRLGMTKEQVLMTRGYPPRHETYSTESDRWVYWSSRFVKLTLVFENNRLIQGRGLN